MLVIVKLELQAFTSDYFIPYVEYFGSLVHIWDVVLLNHFRLIRYMLSNNGKYISSLNLDLISNMYHLEMISVFSTVHKNRYTI